MPPKRKQTSMSKKANYAAQSPKENCDFGSVDEMLTNVDQFIEEVYRDLSMTPTSPSSNATRNRDTLNTTRRLTEQLNESSTAASSTTSPVGATGGALSPPSSNDHSHVSSADYSISSIRSPARRNMDVEIDKIDRMVENAVESLRSNGISMNMSFDNKNTTVEENHYHSDVSGIISSPISPTATPMSALSLNASPILTTPELRTRSLNADNNHSDLSLNNSPTTAEQRTGSLNADNNQSALSLNNSPITTTAEQRTTCLDEENSVNESGPRPSFIAPQIIDLCESQTQTPEVLRQPFHWQSLHEDDDDVVIVSSNLAPVIDLCTPGHMVPSIRRTFEYDQLNRRRLAETIEDVIPVKKPTPEKKTAKSRNGNPPANTSSGPTPFMCAVCMESCLQRQPTSTKCGHVFCNQCINQAVRLTRKCPLCNTKLTNKGHLFRIYL